MAPSKWRLPVRQKCGNPHRASYDLDDDGAMEILEMKASKLPGAIAAPALRCTARACRAMEMRVLVVTLS